MTRKFSNLSFEDFRSMAKDSSLSIYEKIGFPDSYRENKEEIIFKDILSKLPDLSRNRKCVLDIGPGCSHLPKMLIDLCQQQNHFLILLDSKEMLDHLPDKEGIKKIIGFYPDCYPQLDSWKGKIDIILCYSVLHYIFVEAGFFRFIDRSLELLAEGGSMLIGDIPNISKRKRFFSSQNGIHFHQAFTGKNEIPKVDFLQIEEDKIDDAVILGLIMRVRNQGYDAYWLPQDEKLPMANRREDILIARP